MEVRGRITYASELEHGVSQSTSNKWTRQTVVVEYFEKETDRYADHVALTVFGNGLNEMKLKVNDMVDVGFGHSVREYNGRFYNELRAYRLHRVPGVSQEETTPQAPPPPEEPSTPCEVTDSSNDGLPF